MRRLLAACAGLALAAAGAEAQRYRPGIRVRVVDDGTGAAIRRAEVLLDSTVRMVTDSAGEVYLAGLGPGERTLKAGRLGYRPQRVVVRVSSSYDLEVEIALPAMPLRLPEMLAVAKRVEARLAAVRFYERQVRGGGVSWDREQIDAVAGGGTLETLLQRMPGFSLRRLDGDTAWVVVSNRGPGVPRACETPVLVDGQVAGSERLRALAVDYLVGLEAYAGPASAPAELAMLSNGARCGVVVLWTDSGP